MFVGVKEWMEFYLKTWIVPKWGGYKLSDVRTVAVEAWLGTLPLANGTRAKLRNLLHALFNHAIRWEFSTAIRLRWCDSRPSEDERPTC